MNKRIPWAKIGFLGWCAAIVILIVTPDQPWHQWVSGAMFIGLGLFLIIRSEILSRAFLNSDQAFWKTMGVQNLSASPRFARGFLIFTGIAFFLVGLLSFFGKVTTGD